MKLVKILSISLLISSIGIYSSCKKKTEVDDETQSVVDNAVCEQEFMSIQPTVNAHAINTKGTGAKKVLINPCDSMNLVSGDTLFGQSGHVDPTFKIDFNACPTSADGKTRSGIIYVRLNGKIKNPGTTVVIKLSNYVASGLTFTCDSIVLTTLSQYSFNTKVINGHCTTANWHIDWSTDKTITIDTKGTDDGSDDETSISGNSSGVNRQNRSFTVNITAPLVKKSNCKYISSGVLQLTPDGFKTRTVDFGNGTCDDDATFSVNGQTVSFKLN